MPPTLPVTPPGPTMPPPPRPDTTTPPPAETPEQIRARELQEVRDGLKLHAIERMALLVRTNADKLNWKNFTEVKMPHFNREADALHDVAPDKADVRKKCIEEMQKVIDTPQAPMPPATAFTPKNRSDGIQHLIDMKLGVTGGPTWPGNLINPFTSIDNLATKKIDLPNQIDELEKYVQMAELAEVLNSLPPDRAKFIDLSTKLGGTGTSEAKLILQGIDSPLSPLATNYKARLQTDLDARLTIAQAEIALIDATMPPSPETCAKTLFNSACKPDTAIPPVRPGGSHIIENLGLIGAELPPDPIYIGWPGCAWTPGPTGTPTETGGSPRPGPGSSFEQFVVKYTAFYTAMKRREPSAKTDTEITAINAAPATAPDPIRKKYYAEASIALLAGFKDEIVAKQAEAERIDFEIEFWNEADIENKANRMQERDVDIMGDIDAADQAKDAEVLDDLISEINRAITSGQYRPYKAGALQILRLESGDPAKLKELLEKARLEAYRRLIMLKKEEAEAKKQELLQVVERIKGYETSNKEMRDRIEALKLKESAGTLLPAEAKVLALLNEEAVRGMDDLTELKTSVTNLDTLIKSLDAEISRLEKESVGEIERQENFQKLSEQAEAELEAQEGKFDPEAERNKFAVPINEFIEELKGQNVDLSRPADVERIFTAKMLPCVIAETAFSAPIGGAVEAPAKIVKDMFKIVYENILKQVKKGVKQIENEKQKKKPGFFKRNIKRFLGGLGFAGVLCFLPQTMATGAIVAGILGVAGATGAILKRTAGRSQLRISHPENVAELQRDAEKLRKTLIPVEKPGGKPSAPAGGEAEEGSEATSGETYYEKVMGQVASDGAHMMVIEKKKRLTAANIGKKIAGPTAGLSAPDQATLCTIVDLSQKTLLTEDEQQKRQSLIAANMPLMQTFMRTQARNLCTTLETSVTTSPQWNAALTKLQEIYPKYSVTGDPDLAAYAGQVDAMQNELKVWIQGQACLKLQEEFNMMVFDNMAQEARLGYIRRGPRFVDASGNVRRIYAQDYGKRGKNASEQYGLAWDAEEGAGPLFDVPWEKRFKLFGEVATVGAAAAGFGLLRTGLSLGANWLVPGAGLAVGGLLSFANSIGAKERLRRIEKMRRQVEGTMTAPRMAKLLEESWNNIKNGRPAGDLSQEASPAQALAVIHAQIDEARAVRTNPETSQADAATLDYWILRLEKEGIKIASDARRKAIKAVQGNTAAQLIELTATAGQQAMEIDITTGAPTDKDIGTRMFKRRADIGTRAEDISKEAETARKALVEAEKKNNIAFGHLSKAVSMPFSRNKETRQNFVRDVKDWRTWGDTAEGMIFFGLGAAAGNAACTGHLPGFGWLGGHHDNGTDHKDDGKGRGGTDKQDGGPDKGGGGTDKGGGEHAHGGGEHAHGGGEHAHGGGEHAHGGGEHAHGATPDNPPIVPIPHETPLTPAEQATLAKFMESFEHDRLNDTLSPRGGDWAHAGQHGETFAMNNLGKVIGHINPDQPDQRVSFIIKVDGHPHEVSFVPSKLPDYRGYNEDSLQGILKYAEGEAKIYEARDQHINLTNDNDARVFFEKHHDVDIVSVQAGDAHAHGGPLPTPENPDKINPNTPNPNVPPAPVHTPTWPHSPEHYAYSPAEITPANVLPSGAEEALQDEYFKYLIDTIRTLNPDSLAEKGFHVVTGSIGNQENLDYAYKELPDGKIGIDFTGDGEFDAIGRQIGDKFVINEVIMHKGGAEQHYAFDNEINAEKALNAIANELGSKAHYIALSPHLSYVEAEGVKALYSDNTPIAIPKDMVVEQITLNESGVSAPHNGLIMWDQKNHHALLVLDDDKNGTPEAYELPPSASLEASKQYLQADPSEVHNFLTSPAHKSDVKNFLHNAEMPVTPTPTPTTPIQYPKLDVIPHDANQANSVDGILKDRWFAHLAKDNAINLNDPEAIAQYKNVGWGLYTDTIGGKEVTYGYKLEGGDKFALDYNLDGKPDAIAHSVGSGTSAYLEVDRIIDSVSGKEIPFDAGNREASLDHIAKMLDSNGRYIEVANGQIGYMRTGADNFVYLGNDKITVPNGMQVEEVRLQEAGAGGAQRDCIAIWDPNKNAGIYITDQDSDKNIGNVIDNQNSVASFQAMKDFLTGVKGGGGVQRGSGFGFTADELKNKGINIDEIRKII